MKAVITLFVFFILKTNIMAKEMKKHIIKTRIGDIAVFSTIVENTTPILFLHGVYFDHHLWDYQIEHISDRTVVAIDMPLHGESNKNIIAQWNLDDCANMLLEILDSLNIKQTVAIGHSWGSMTIIRASAKQPSRFKSIGLCNMPWQSGYSKKSKFFWQHTMLGFRKFYAKQAAKSLYGKNNLKGNPSLFDKLLRPMLLLNKKKIKQVDREVIIYANDISDLLQHTKVKSIALIGKDDYLTAPPFVQTEIVEGGHVSPLQAEKEVVQFIQKVAGL
jgi:3-oxoadipate enol-lactonase